MAYGKYKDLFKGTQSDKFLRDKAFKIASNPKYGGYQKKLSLIKNLVQAVVLYLCLISNNLKMNFANQFLVSFKHKKVITIVNAF